MNKVPQAVRHPSENYGASEFGFMNSDWAGVSTSRSYYRAFEMHPGVGASSQSANNILIRCTLRTFPCPLAHFLSSSIPVQIVVCQAPILSESLPTSCRVRPGTSTALCSAQRSSISLPTPSIASTLIITYSIPFSPAYTRCKSVQLTLHHE